MFTVPRVAVFVAVCSCLAITVAILVLPADLFWAYASPERYLAGVREFDGPAYVSDDYTHTRTPPSAVIAWRRLAAARDATAFARLLAARSPAARLYGLAGLRLLASPLAERGVERLRESADTVLVNWACVERKVTLSAAVSELDAPRWADSLLSARGGCE
jgi:hypothetical protein